MTQVVWSECSHDDCDHQILQSFVNSRAFVTTFCRVVRANNVVTRRSMFA